MNLQSRFLITALDLISKLLTFDPKHRLSVEEALSHPWLSSYHDLNEYPEDPEKFTRWREVELLDTTEEFRTALYREVMEFRAEVRSIGADTAEEEYHDALDGSFVVGSASPPSAISHSTSNGNGIDSHLPPQSQSQTLTEAVPFPSTGGEDIAGDIPPQSAISRFAKDPYRAYARRASMFSIYDHDRDPRTGPPTATIPEEGGQGSYMTSRSRIQSSDTLGAAAAATAPRFLRQLSTVSISGLADASRANGIVGGGIVPDITKAADAPVSELPSEWAKNVDQGLGSSS